MLLRAKQVILKWNKTFWSFPQVLFLLSLWKNYSQSCTVFTVMYGCETEKAMAPHSSTLAWKIPWTEESGSLQSIGLLGVGHD